jgi:hypothetical protein
MFSRGMTAGTGTDNNKIVYFRHYEILSVRFFETSGNTHHVIAKEEAPQEPHPSFILNEAEES